MLSSMIPRKPSDFLWLERTLPIHDRCHNSTTARIKTHHETFTSHSYTPTCTSHTTTHHTHTPTRDSLQLPSPVSRLQPYSTQSTTRQSALCIDLPVQQTLTTHLLPHPLTTNLQTPLSIYHITSVYPHTSYNYSTFTTPISSPSIIPPRPDTPITVRLHLNHITTPHHITTPSNRSEPPMSIPIAHPLSNCISPQPTRFQLIPYTSRRKPLTLRPPLLSTSYVPVPPSRHTPQPHPPITHQRTVCLSCPSYQLSFSSSTQSLIGQIQSSTTEYN
nr:mucin-2-like [Penaeus vannamei]